MRLDNVLRPSFETRPRLNAGVAPQRLTQKETPKKRVISALAA